MVVIVPINQNEMVEILFEYSEQIPNGIYLDLMNLMKQYHEYGDNRNIIHEYINKNKNNLNETLFNKIKSLIVIEPIVNDDSKCNMNNFRIISLVIFICVIVIFVPTYFIASRYIL